MGHKVDSCNTDLHKLFYTPHGTHRRAIVLKEDVLKKVEERARLLMIRQANEQIKEMN